MEWHEQLHASLSTHHAHCVVGDCVRNEEEVVRVLEEKCALPVRGNPDVHELIVENLTIDEARSLTEAASRRPFGGDRSIFLVSFSSATREAQNALLKLLEDPADAPLFILLTPSAEYLLPTLHSRLSVTQGFRSEPRQEDALAFLTASPAERVLLLKPIIDTKDKSSAIALLDALEVVLIEKGVTSAYEGLKEVLFCREYLLDRAASIKILLEHLATVLPKEKTTT